MHVVVTGSSAGIGRAIAARVARARRRACTDSTSRPRRCAGRALPRRSRSISPTARAIDRAARALTTRRCARPRRRRAARGRLGALDPAAGERCGACTSTPRRASPTRWCPPMAERGRGRVVLDRQPRRAGHARAQPVRRDQGGARSRSRGAGPREVVARGVTVNVVSPAATATAMLDDPARAASAPRAAAARAATSSPPRSPSSWRSCCRPRPRRSPARTSRSAAAPRCPPEPSPSIPHEDRRDPRIDASDPLGHPQRVHRLLEDDAEPRRGRHRRGPRRPAGGRLRLQLQRPLRPGRADPRALRAAPARGRSGIAARRHRRQPRSAPHLGADDDQREAGRPRRALGRGRHDRHGGVGRGREDRGQAAATSCSPSATATARANPRVFVYAAGGYYYPGKDLDGLRARDDELSRARLHRRQDEDRRRERSPRTARASRPC